MNGATDKAQQEREKYVRAFNDTMIKIWKEQIALLGVVDTGALYRSTVAIGMTADGKYTSVTLTQSFNTYGLFVDWGVGSNTPRGNPGDISCKREQSGACSGYAERSRNRCEANIGRANPRKRKRWFSRKYYASFKNIEEFYADNLGRECVMAITNALTKDALRKAVTL